jgi:hypothetical protein
MYDPDKHFVERIEIAIQRFKQKRRMHEAYSNIFNKWMRFGGVESAPRMFSGLSAKDMAGMDAEEIARARAIHQVPWDREDTKHWVLDFVGVGQAFLYVGTQCLLKLRENHADRTTDLPSSQTTTGPTPSKSRPPVKSSVPFTTTSSTIQYAPSIVKILTKPSNSATSPRQSSPEFTTLVWPFPEPSTLLPVPSSAAPKLAPTPVTWNGLPSSEKRA